MVECPAKSPWWGYDVITIQKLHVTLINDMVPYYFCCKEYIHIELGKEFKTVAHLASGMHNIV